MTESTALFRAVDRNWRGLKGSGGLALPFMVRQAHHERGLSDKLRTNGDCSTLYVVERCLREQVQPTDMLRFIPSCYRPCPHVGLPEPDPSRVFVLEFE